MKAIALALVVSSGAFAQEQVWTWVDESGEEHYTNDKASIPEKFLAKATSTAGAELSVLQTKGEATAPAAVGPAAPTPKPAGPSAARAPAIKVVLFEASTNSASKTLRRAGVLEKLVTDNPGLQLERVEFSTAVERAQKLNVSDLPTLLFLDPSGAERGRLTGLTTLKEAQAELDKARGKR